MIKKSVLIIYFIITTNILCSTLVVSSFNSLHLGWDGKNISETAQILSLFDLIGIQEVMKKKSIKNLANKMTELTGEKWHYHVSQYSVGYKNYREYYGYIWRESKIKLIKKIGYYPDKNNDFIREPYGVYFKAQNFDFIYVLAHSIYGDKITERRKEAKNLVNVYNYFKNQIDNEKDIIIGGDFNLPGYDKSFKGLLTHEDKIFYAIDSYFHKTTIGKTGLSKSYDNFFYSYVNTKEYTGNNGVYDFTLSPTYIKLYGEKRYKILRKKISDHLPIFIEFNTNNDDD